METNIEPIMTPAAPPRENSAEPVRRSCGMCDFYGETAATVCPQCGEPTLQSPTVVSLCGLAMALLGTFLMLFTGWILSLAHERLSRPDPDPLAKYGVREPPADPSLLYLILGALIAVGAVFTFTGVVQFYRERRDLRLIRLSFMLTSAFYTACQVIMYFW